MLCSGRVLPLMELWVNEETRYGEKPPLVAKCQMQGQLGQLAKCCLHLLSGYCVQVGVSPLNVLVHILFIWHTKSFLLYQVILSHILVIPTAHSLILGKQLRQMTYLFLGELILQSFLKHSLQVV